MLNRRPFQPQCELLETRLAMSAGLALYPVGFIGPLPAGAHPAPLVADSMIINPTSPNLGNPFTARLQITQPPNTTWTSTVWQYTVVFGGVTASPRVAQGTYNVATITSDEPGTYTVQSQSTFTSSIPGVAPKVITLSAQVGVPEATTAVTTFGIGQQSTLGSVIMAQDRVSSSLGPIGPSVAAMAQENVAQIFFPTTGDSGAGTPGWVPPAPSGTFRLVSGVITDGISPGNSNPEWVATPVGSVYCQWTQDLQLAWQITGVGASGFRDYPEASPLNSLNWSIKKISTTRWELDQ